MTINLKGMFDKTDSFVKHFNEVMTGAGIRIRMKYFASLYEIQIQHLDGTNFSLEEYYDDGIFMDLIGFKRLNQGSNIYTNINTPKLFSQRLIFISIPELGTYSITTKRINSSSKPILTWYSVNLASRLWRILITPLPMNSMRIIGMSMK